MKCPECGLILFDDEKIFDYKEGEKYECVYCGYEWTVMDEEPIDFGDTDYDINPDLEDK